MTSWHHFLIFHEQPPPSSELDMAIDSDFNIMGLQQQTQIVTIKKKKTTLISTGKKSKQSRLKGCLIFASQILC